MSLTLREGAKAQRIAELIHRSIPYPLLLVIEQPEGVRLSAANLRWSQGQSGQMVLDGAVVTTSVDSDAPETEPFLASLDLAAQPKEHLQALYQGWIERLEAHSAAQHTGTFEPAHDPEAAERRRVALTEHQRLTKEIATLRAQAAKERQLNRRVDLNLKLKAHETALEKLAEDL